VKERKSEVGIHAFRW